MACKCKTEVFARVVGFYTPIQQWNKGKKAEYFNRRPYKFGLADFKGPGARGQGPAATNPESQITNTEGGR